MLADQWPSLRVDQLGLSTILHLFQLLTLDRKLKTQSSPRTWLTLDLTDNFRRTERVCLSCFAPLTLKKLTLAPRCLCWFTVWAAPTRAHNYTKIPNYYANEASQEEEKNSRAFFCSNLLVSCFDCYRFELTQPKFLLPLRVHKLRLKLSGLFLRKVSRQTKLLFFPFSSRERVRRGAEGWDGNPVVS